MGAQGAVAGFVAQAELHVETALVCPVERRAGGFHGHLGAQAVLLGQQPQARGLQVQVEQALHRVAAGEALCHRLLHLLERDRVARWLLGPVFGVGRQAQGRAAERQGKGEKKGSTSHGYRFEPEGRRRFRASRLYL